MPPQIPQCDPPHKSVVFARVDPRVGAQHCQVMVSKHLSFTYIPAGIDRASEGMDMMRIQFDWQGFLLCRPYRCQV